ncbi:MAG: hypothetical protein LBL67_05465 [Coriobacteriales bacterium]|jgi:hypothetical protein|nr:hypothetical protein [Coriobacteriales bacterium]
MSKHLAAPAGALTPSNNANVPTATTIAALDKSSGTLNNHLVSFSGEAIGDVVNAEPGYKWVTVADTGDNNAISVYMTDQEVAQIHDFGFYGQSGDLITVDGIFNLSCRQHDGLTDVHATTVSVSSVGHADPAVPSMTMLVLALALILVAILIGVVHHLLRERNM